ncbi:SymE family type I addiction module toxin [Collimonas fungivorans]|uniref:SymE family type I addiction module toxin n=1 Tax=Collimonas fungivorans TaxID=158899 RepID=UPI00167FDA4A|nr:SymE family type I addiction module toxin [Collimonas fungivorans]
MNQWFHLPKASSQPKSAADDSPAATPARVKTAHRDRWLTVGLYPEFHAQKPWIRLHGVWLKEAGFNPQTKVKVRVMQGCLVITTE